MAHPVDVHVGKNLKTIRNLRRMSQTDVATKLGLSFQQIQKYEIGSNRIAASRLWELAEIFGVTVGYFFEGLPEKEKADAAELFSVTDILRNDRASRLMMAFSQLPESQQKSLLAMAESLSVPA